MNLKTVIAASAFAVMGTMGHSAVLSAADSGSTFDLLADDYQFQEIFDGTNVSPLTFTFENTHSSSAVVTISSATINQLSNAFFVGGATVAWDNNGVVASAAQGETAGGALSFNLAAGASDTLTLTFGASTQVGTSNRPDIDFLVSADLAPIPLPAGMLLMGTALAGFGVMRRRQKAAA